MRVPVIRGVIERRILVNFRVQPDVLAGQLPEPFRPLLVSGVAMAGICLIKLKQIRPVGLPAAFGHTSENCAHRAAVQWDENGRTRTGVYIFGRHSSSRLNVLLGGSVFPGVHRQAEFSVSEQSGQYCVQVAGHDMRITLDARRTDIWPGGSAFASLNDALSFFEAGALGYSPAAHTGRFEGMELRSSIWKGTALEATAVFSSYFSDAARFSPGAVELDSAILMSNIPHEWHWTVPITRRKCMGAC